MAITLEQSGTVAENDAAATTLNVAYPTTGLAADDVWVLIVGVNSAMQSTLPAGWTSGIAVTGGGGTSPALRIAVKVATGSESGSLAVTTPSATSRGQLLRFRGVDTTNVLDVAGTTVGASTAATSQDIPSLTTTTTGVALVAAASANAPGGTWTTPASQGGGWTETAETSGATPSTGIEALVWSGSGATGTVTMTRSSNVRFCAGMVALRPATGGAITGSGAATAAAATSGGAGAVRVAGSGASRAPVADSAGAAALRITGAGASVAPAATSHGSGGTTSAVTGSGHSVAPVADSQGAGAVRITGSGSARPAAGRASGAAAVRITGSGASEAPAGIARGSDLVTVTPPERILTVRAEVRVLSVKAEDRTLTIPADNRTLIA